MGLYEVIEGLAPGRCVEYHGREYLMVMYQPYFQFDLRLDVAVRTRGVNSAGEVIGRTSSARGTLPSGMGIAPVLFGPIR